ncbi:MAG: hypothetical protein WA584_18305 [Pyrinomonadaceae bacterium]
MKTKECEKLKNPIAAVKAFAFDEKLLFIAAMITTITHKLQVFSGFAGKKRY